MCVVCVCVCLNCNGVSEARLTHYVDEGVFQIPQPPPLCIDCKDVPVCPVSVVLGTAQSIQLTEAASATVVHRCVVLSYRFISSHLQVMFSSV